MRVLFVGKVCGGFMIIGFNYLLGIVLFIGSQFYRIFEWFFRGVVEMLVQRKCFEMMECYFLRYSVFVKLEIFK